MALLYVDATSGGMVLQIVLSGFVGGIVVVKMFWHSIVDTVMRRHPDATNDTDENPDCPAS